MEDKFVIKKDGEKCEISAVETSKGLKMKTKGSGCKKMMGKDFFNKIEVSMPD